MATKKWNLWRSRYGGLTLSLVTLLWGTGLAIATTERLDIAFSREQMRWGQPVTLTVTASSPHHEAVQGGITVSFSSNVIVVEKDSEATLFYENSEVYTVGHLRTMRSRDVMIENWYRSWSPRADRTMRVTFYPLRKGVLTIKVRAAFILDLRTREVVNFPSDTGCKDQQGYPARCYNIFVEESPDFLVTLRRIVASTELENPVFIRMTQRLIHDPRDTEARAFFGLGEFQTSERYLERYLEMLAERLSDPEIQSSPLLMTYLRRLVNDPSDEAALRFFKVEIKRGTRTDPLQESISRSQEFLREQRAGAALLQLMIAEGDMRLGPPISPATIVLLYKTRELTFPRNEATVERMVDAIIKLKPHSRFIRQKELVSGYSYLDLKRALRDR